MNSRPFFARLLLAFAALLGLIVAVSGGVMYWAAQRTLRDQQVADLERLIPLTREWLGVGAGGGDTPDERTQTRLRDAARLLNTRVTVIAGDGRVTFDTLVGLEKLNNHNDRPEVVAARAGVPAHSVRPSASLGEEAVYVAELLDPRRPDGPVIRFSYPQRTWIAFRVPVWPVLGGSVLAAVLTVGGLAWTLQRRWIGPTHKLVATADRLAAGEWHARAEPGGADELQFFSTRLNQVASHAQRQLADLRDQRADLQALVDTLPDPVLATDDAGRVILINLPAARLLALARSRALG
ncbi:MAG TPA: PAS domain-containing protein, partial [Humisphaera sp.]